MALCYLGKEVVDAVDGQVEGRETAGEEAPPPPMVILTGEDVNNSKTILVIHTPRRFQSSRSRTGLLCNMQCCGSGDLKKVSDLIGSFIIMLKFLIECEIFRLRHSHMASCIISKIIVKLWTMLHIKNFPYNFYKCQALQKRLITLKGTIRPD